MPCYTWPSHPPSRHPPRAPKGLAHTVSPVEQASSLPIERERATGSTPPQSLWQSVVASPTDGPLLEWCHDWAPDSVVLAWWAYDEAALRAEVSGYIWTPSLAAATEALSHALKRTTIEELSPEGRVGPTTRLQGLVPWLISRRAGDWEGELAPLLTWGPDGRSLVRTVLRHVGGIPRHTVRRLCLMGYSDLMAENPALASHPALGGVIARHGLNLIHATDNDGSVDEMGRQMPPRGKGVLVMTNLLSAGWVPGPSLELRLRRYLKRWAKYYPKEAPLLAAIPFHARYPRVSRALHRALLPHAKCLSPTFPAERRRAIGAPWLRQKHYLEWSHGWVTSGDCVIEAQQELMELPRAMAMPAVRQGIKETAFSFPTLLPELTHALFWETALNALERHRVPFGGLNIMNPQMKRMLEHATPERLANMPSEICATLLADEAPSVREWMVGVGLAGWSRMKRHPPPPPL